MHFESIWPFARCTNAVTACLALIKLLQLRPSPRAALDISHNGLGVFGTIALAGALEHNQTLLVRTDVVLLHVSHHAPTQQYLQVALLTVCLYVVRMCRGSTCRSCGCWAREAA